MRLDETLGKHLTSYNYAARRIQWHLRIGYVAMALSALGTVYYLQSGSRILSVYPVMVGTLIFYYLFMIRNAFDAFDVAQFYAGVEVYAFGIVVRLRRGSDPLRIHWREIVDVYIEYGTIKLYVVAPDTTVRPTVLYRVTYLEDPHTLLQQMKALAADYQAEVQRTSPVASIGDD